MVDYTNWKVRVTNSMWVAPCERPVASCRRSWCRGLRKPMPARGHLAFWRCMPYCFSATRPGSCVLPLASPGPRPIPPGTYDLRSTLTSPTLSGGLQGRQARLSPVRSGSAAPRVHGDRCLASPAVCAHGSGSASVAGLRGEEGRLPVGDCGTVQHFDQRDKAAQRPER